MTLPEAKAIVAKGQPHPQFDCDLYMTWVEANAFIEGYNTALLDREV